MFNLYHKSIIPDFNQPGPTYPLFEQGGRAVVYTGYNILQCISDSFIVGFVLEKKRHKFILWYKTTDLKPHLFLKFLVEVRQRVKPLYLSRNKLIASGTSLFLKTGKSPFCEIKICNLG